MKANIVKIFKEVYENEVDAIFRFSLLRVSDREQALDITQETFLRLWQNLSEGRTEIKNERAFLFTVAHNLIIDWYRKKKSVSLDKMMENKEINHEPGEQMTAVDLELEEEGRYLLEKIIELPESYRQSVYLRFVEGLSPPEIGQILGISAGAASVRINRGIEELRKISGYNNEK